MMERRNVLLERQLLDVLNRFERPMTPAEIAHRLQMPLDKIEESVDTLKTSGVLREAKIEDLLREGK